MRQTLPDQIQSQDSPADAFRCQAVQVRRHLVLVLDFPPDHQRISRQLIFFSLILIGRWMQMSGNGMRIGFLDQTVFAGASEESARLQRG